VHKLQNSADEVYTIYGVICMGNFVTHN